MKSTGGGHDDNWNGQVNGFRPPSCVARPPKVQHHPKLSWILADEANVSNNDKHQLSSSNHHTSSNNNLTHPIIFTSSLFCKLRCSLSSPAASPSPSSSFQGSHLSPSQEFLAPQRKQESSVVKNKEKKNDDDDDPNCNKNVDSGYAWVILAIMFFINASTFGTARTYGLIFDKQVRQEDESRSLAALPFTIMGAVENMGGPLTGYLLTRTSSWRLTVFIGSSLIALSHLLAALFDSLIGQTITMGLMCGLGLSFVTMSSFQINNAYFVRYRSRAFGLGLTGAAFGTFYISPLCKYVLNNHSTKLCYLVLGLILLPNVPLSLLLRPLDNKPHEQVEEKVRPEATANLNQEQRPKLCKSISGLLVDKQQQGEANSRGLWQNILLVVKSPIFHLIWPTQLLFCWLNFVFGMVIVDVGEDRGMGCNQLLIHLWVVGQLVGRLGLGSLVDMKFISIRSFTVICFAAISLATWSLNNIHSDKHGQLILSMLVFVLSVFISTLYILFNASVECHMDKSLTSLSIGISSFTGSFFPLPRASLIGHYRDTPDGNYDDMFTMFSQISMAAALVWLLAPEFCQKFKLILWQEQHPGRLNLKLALPATLGGTMKQQQQPRK